MTTRGTRVNGSGKAVTRSPLLKKRPTEERTFCLDDDLSRAVTEAQEAYDQAERFHDRIVRSDVSILVAQSLERLEEARLALEAAKVAADEAKWTLRLEGIPRKEYWDERSKPEHEPSDEQKAKHMAMLAEEMDLSEMTSNQVNRLGLKVNPDTWPRWLVTRCGKLSEEDAEAIFGDEAPWTNDDIQTMYQAAEIACNKTSLISR